MLRHFLPIAAVPLTVLTLCGVALAAPASGDGLSGTWQVHRTCVTGCTGSTTTTEVVSPHANNVFTATGATEMALYRLGTQVLVHSAKASSLLTIRRLGQFMSGVTVDGAGNTYTITWRCIAAPGTPAASSGAAPSRAGGVAPRAVVRARAEC